MGQEIERPSWGEYFFKIVHDVATRSTCLRRQVGAIAVKDKRILATGYNGQIGGSPHCETCLREEREIPRGEGLEICMAVHAEQNVVVQAAIHGISLQGSTIYCIYKPCTTCFKLLASCRVLGILYKEDYPDNITDIIINKAGWTIDRFKKSDIDQPLFFLHPMMRKLL